MIKEGNTLGKKIEQEKLLELHHISNSLSQWQIRSVHRKDTKRVTRQSIDYNHSPESQMQKPQRVEATQEPKGKKSTMRKTWQKAG